MNLPIIEILNQNFIKDLTDLNNRIKTENKNSKFNFDKLISSLSEKDVIVNNFNKVTEHLTEEYKDIKDKIEKQKMLQHLMLNCNSYIEINNIFAKLMQEYKNITLNDIVKNVLYERYSVILPIFKNEKYNNDYSKQISKIIKSILESKDAMKLNDYEIEISNLIPNFMNRVIKNKNLDREDDYKIAIFTFGTRITSKIFRELFAIARQNQQNQAELVKPVNNEQLDKKEGKNLTKDIPADGPPSDYKKKH